MNTQTVAFELKALREKLLRATYRAVFAPDPAQRTSATTEAVAIQRTIDDAVGRLAAQAGHITDFMRSPAPGYQLDTLDGVIHLLEPATYQGAMASMPEHAAGCAHNFGRPI